MKQLIVGYGEIGKAVEKVIGCDVYHVDRDGQTDAKEPVGILHVCFPYSENFVKDLKDYIERFQPEHVIVYSTVQIGTCEQIGTNIVHSPVEGKHPNLDLSIRYMQRWLGVAEESEAEFFKNYFQLLGIRTKHVNSSRFTEALKLMSTSEFGVNLLFADYKARVAEIIGMPYELTMEWNETYNRLYQLLSLDSRFQKFVLDDPHGRIGGHCVRENAFILGDMFPSDMLKEITKMKGRNDA